MAAAGTGRCLPDMSTVRLSDRSFLSKQHGQATSSSPPRDRCSRRAQSTKQLQTTSVAVTNVAVAALSGVGWQNYQTMGGATRWAGRQVRRRGLRLLLFLASMSVADVVSQAQRRGGVVWAKHTLQPRSGVRLLQCAGFSDCGRRWRSRVV